jgi:hypothetical protein
LKNCTGFRRLNSFTFGFVAKNTIRGEHPGKRGYCVFPDAEMAGDAVAASFLYSALA